MEQNNKGKIQDQKRVFSKKQFPSLSKRNKALTDQKRRPIGVEDRLIRVRERYQIIRSKRTFGFPSISTKIKISIN